METEATLREKPQSISTKLQKEKSARTEKKEHRKIMKKKIKGKKEKEIAHQYFINFEPFYCNVTAIYVDLFYFLYSCEKARKYSKSTK